MYQKYKTQVNILLSIIVYLIIATITTRILNFTLYDSDGLHILRISFSHMVVMISSIILGPYIGGFIGFTKDFISFSIDNTCVYKDYLFSIGIINFLWGFLPYYLYHYLKKYTLWIRLSITILITQILLNVIAMSIILSSSFNLPFNELILSRTISQFILIPIYIFFTYLFINHLEYIKRINYMRLHDCLTNVYNRHYFLEIEKRFNTYNDMCVLFTDLNGLKAINDEHGHNIGDKFLVKMAHILKASCRKEDIVIRWGGDEFIVLLLNTKIDNAYGTANRIIATCQTIVINKIPLETSIGVGIKNSSNKLLVEVIQEAEDEMYNMKDSS